MRDTFQLRQAVATADFWMEAICTFPTGDGDASYHRLVARFADALQLL